MNLCTKGIGSEPVFSNWDPALALYRRAIDGTWLTANHVTTFQLSAPHTLSICGELEELVELSRTSARDTYKRQILAEHRVESFNDDQLLGRLIQIGYEKPFLELPERAPRARELIFRAAEDAVPAIYFWKQKFNRARPYTLLPALPIEDLREIEWPRHASYPSGHSTHAHIGALLLAMLVPNQREVLMTEAFNIARRREIAGLHFRGDTVAGAVLAAQIVSKLIENKAFSAELEKCRW